MKKEFAFEDQTFSFHYYDENEYQQLNEANHKGRHLIGDYYYDIHQPHNSTGDYHIHLRNKGNEILSMNRGGNAHDGYHGVKIPSKAFKALKKELPDWKWPENRIIESQEYTFFLQPNSPRYLRPVRVFSHRDFNSNQVTTYIGFFHCFGVDVFMTGGGYKERTVAVIEAENGEVRKVSMDAIKFIDVD